MSKPDPQRHLVYAAEAATGHFFGGPYQFRTIASVRRWLRTVVAAPAFTARFAPWVVQVKRHPAGPRAWSGGRIELHSRVAYRKLVVLHELAHVVSAEDCEHDATFCSNYLYLVTHFMGAEVARALLKAFDAHGVNYKPRYKKVA